MSHPVVTCESAPGLKPNSRYRHAFAIIRVDESSDPEMPIEQRVTVKRIMFDREEAEREVERLNRLRAGKRGRYFSQIARLEPTGQAEAAAESAVANRIGAFIPEPTPNMITPGKRAKLEDVFVPESVQKSLPEGWGFPAFRACEICAEPSQTSVVKWYEYYFSILKKNTNDHIELLVASEHRDEGRKTVVCALRLFPDLTEDSIFEMTPLDALKLVVDRFGLTMISGSNKGKLFLREEFAIPTILLPGVERSHIVVGSVPEGHSYKATQFYSLAKSVVRIPLAFCIDTTEYLQWVESH